MTRSRKPARLALLLSAVLAFTALATPAAAEPVPTECSDEANFEVQAPSLFGFVGVPLAPAPLSTSSAAAVTWSTECMELPEGVTFDQASASFAGAPASEGEGGGMIVATSESGRGVARPTLRVGPASALQVTMTDASDDPLDPSDLAPGTEFRLSGAGLPDNTQVRALIGGEEIASTAIENGEGAYTLDGAIAEDATSGAVEIVVEFTMPGGEQRYTTRVAGDVRVLAIGGPADLTPVAGTAVEYTFPVSGNRGDVIYTLEGTLPAGLSFDASRGVISGTATSAQAKRDLTITATDARASVTHRATVTVLASAVVFPTIAAIIDPSGLASVFGGLLDSGLTPEQALERANQQNRPSAGTRVFMGINPNTGHIGFLVGPPDTDVSDAASWRMPTDRTPVDGIVVGTPDAATIEELARAQQDAMIAAIVAQQAAIKAENDAMIARLAAQAAERAGIDAARQGDRQAQQQAVRESNAAQVQRIEAERRQREAQLDEDRAKKVAEAAERLEAERRAKLERDGESNPLPEGTQVRVEMHSTPVLLGTATVGASGGFALTVTAPAGLTPGLHHLVVTYTLPDGTVHTSRTPVTALHPDALVPASNDILPVTGTDVSALAAAGSVLSLLIGMGLMLIARRREARTS
ncbi:MAG: putative Ig domain-containing protein [Salinibacterium sp.]|nr:putative Ig domain-containing protein [Salinibacterium sp.]MBF0671792.1 putative Ig domain-containing protein [Salinibacterium sp.]